jgi:hypothetical protein
MERRFGAAPTNIPPIISFSEVLRATPTPGDPSEEELRRFGQRILREPSEDDYLRKPPGPDNPGTPSLTPEDQAAFTHDPEELTKLWRMATIGSRVLATIEATDTNAN